MRVLTKDDRPMMLAMIADFEKMFGFKCDRLSLYIWMSNYSEQEVRVAFEKTKKWTLRKVAKHESFTELDVHKYITSVCSRRAVERHAVEEILGEGGAL
jgi:hypothetical protein